MRLKRVCLMNVYPIEVGKGTRRGSAGMKQNLFSAGMALFAMLAGNEYARAQTSVTVDASQPWGGYMNVFNLPAAGGGYQFGSGWGAGDLRAAFGGGVLTLRPCTNVSNPTDTYWTLPDGSGNKQMQANYYVDTASLVNSNINFAGNVVDFVLDPSQNCQAFIKVFPSDYSSTLQAITTNLTQANQYFAINLLANNPAAAHVQYGFILTGPNGSIAPSAYSQTFITIRTNVVDPLNVLVNPGFEAGLAGWSVYGSGGNIETAATLYYNGGNPNGASNVLVYGGINVQKVFPQFTGGQNYSGIFQDIPTGPGSQWKASAKFLTHHQDQIAGPNFAWLEVTFRDVAKSVLATYKSPILDNSSPVDAWLDMSVTNDVDGGLVLKAPDGTTFVRVQEVYSQPSGYSGGSVYADAMVLDNLSPSDPNIKTLPADSKKVVGQTANFTVVATGTTTLSYQWQRYGTNLVDDARIVGATTATLTIHNVGLDDSTSYTVTVSDAANSLDVSATLLVQTAEQAANLLVNSSFETTAFSPWVAFNGGGLRTIGNSVVTPFDGDYEAIVFNGGQYNGAYQDVAVTPGQIFTADGKFFLSSSELPSPNYTCWLEVQFRNSGGTPLALFKSDIIGQDANLPQDIWFTLQATNGFAGDFVTPTTNSRYLVAPAGTSSIRYQITLFAAAGGSGGVYYDAMSLLQKTPVTVMVAKAAGGLNLSFPTQVTSTYQVVYKNRLSDATWTPIGSAIPGNGAVQSVPVSYSGGSRFYSVITQ